MHYDMYKTITHNVHFYTGYMKKGKLELEQNEKIIKMSKWTQNL